MKFLFAFPGYGMNIINTLFMFYRNVKGRFCFIPFIVFL